MENSEHGNMKNTIRRSIKEVAKRIFSKQLIYSVKSNGDAIALTFDDGPHPVNTAKILEILKKEGVKATFFLTGKEVEKYPEAAQAIAHCGHDIGSHSYSHTKDASGKEIARGVSTIMEKIGIGTRLYRPPYGSVTPLLIFFAMIKKLVIVMWSVDSDDTEIKDREMLFDSMKNKNISSGDILLMHEDYAHTVEALGDIIGSLKSRGFVFITVTELLSSRQEK